MGSCREPHRVRGVRRVPDRHAPHAAAQILAAAALVQRAAVLALHEAAARRRLLVQQRVQEAKILRAVLFHTAI